MILCLFITTFWIIVLTGPAGVEARDKIRARRDFARARVLYLPSASCR